MLSLVILAHFLFLNESAELLLLLLFKKKNHAATSHSMFYIADYRRKNLLSSGLPKQMKSVELKRYFSAASL